MANQSNITIYGNTVKDLFDQTKHEVTRLGQEQTTLHGKRKILSNVTLVLEHPEIEEERYPFWQNIDEQWYLNHFVRQSVNPPEKSRDPEVVFPYTYAWRTRFFDMEYGNTSKLIQLLLEHNYTDLPFTRKEDFDQLIRETYKNMHPDLVFVILHWLGKNNMRTFLSNKDLLHELINSCRRDLLLDIVNSLNTSIRTGESSTVISSYPHIDNHKMIEAKPNFLQLQVAPIINRNQTITGLESLFIFRQLTVSGLIQLEHALAREWSEYISEQTDLPITRVVFYTQQLYLPTEDQTPQPDIQSYTMSMASGYQPSTLDIEHYLQQPQYIKKAELLAEDY